MKVLLLPGACPANGGHTGLLSKVASRHTPFQLLSAELLSPVSWASGRLGCCASAWEHKAAWAPATRLPKTRLAAAVFFVKLAEVEVADAFSSLHAEGSWVSRLFVSFSAAFGEFLLICPDRTKLLINAFAKDLDLIRVKRLFKQPSS